MGLVILADFNLTGNVQMRVGPGSNPDATFIKLNENNDQIIEIKNGTGDFITLDGRGGVASNWFVPAGLE